MAFKNILVAVHPREDETVALDRAMLLARRCGAKLNLQMVVWKPQFSMDFFHHSSDLQESRDEAVQAAENRLEKLSANLDGAEISHREVHWGHPFHEPVLQAVERHRPDLVVMATAREDRPSTSEWQLIRSCKTPLLLCHQRHWSDPPKVLACVDPGHAHDKTEAVDRDIIATAERLQDSLGKRYQLLHAAGMTPDLRGDQPYTYQFREKQDARNEAAIRALLPERSRDTIVSFSHSTPAEAILAFVAERGFDLCLLGLINRGRWRELLIGSTPRQLISRKNCDLLLVPHPGVNQDPAD